MWHDHSRGWEPAKKDDHLNWTKLLYHNACGTRILTSASVWTCSGPCKIGYTLGQMSRFDDDAMATRFHLRPIPDHETYTIVWKSDPITKKMYTCEVPTSEAHKYERFDYYDRK